VHVDSEETVDCHSQLACVVAVFSFANDCVPAAEADLGMFSMFGRTGAAQKRGPHKRTGKFLQHSNMPEIIEIIIRKRFCAAR